MKIEYQEVSLQEVLNYYAKDFKLKDGEIWKYQAFVDTAKQTVVFKLYVQEDTTKCRITSEDTQETNKENHE